MYFTGMCRTVRSNWQYMHQQYTGQGGQLRCNWASLMYIAAHDTLSCRGNFNGDKLGSMNCRLQSPCHPGRGERLSYVWSVEALSLEVLAGMCMLMLKRETPTL